MMQGSGVTNYATDSPSFAFTASTTEFDDEVIRRGILTKEQVLTAKGASAETVTKLLVEERNSQPCEAAVLPVDVPYSDDTFESDFDHDADDEIMQQYRQRRLIEVGKEYPGEIVRIDRSEWTKQVNDASKQHWVVVCLSSTPCKTGCMEASLRTLARETSNVRFVVIESKHAFEQEWPQEYLPTLFLYRNGRMQHQLLSLATNITPAELEGILEEHGVCRS